VWRPSYRGRRRPAGQGYPRRALTEVEQRDAERYIAEMRSHFKEVRSSLIGFERARRGGGGHELAVEGRQFWRSLTFCSNEECNGHVVHK